MFLIKRSGWEVKRESLPHFRHSEIHSQSSEPSSTFRHSVPLFTFRRSEPSCLHSLVFKATISFQPSIQSHYQFLVSVFRATTSFHFGVQSHHIFSVWAFKATISSQFDVQSHHLFSLQAFNATICFQFGIQSQPFFLVMAFRATILFPLSILSYHNFSITMFRVISSQFGVQSHISSLTFRAIILSRSSIHCHFFGVQSCIPSVWSHRPHSGIQSHHFSTIQCSESSFIVWRSEPSSSLNNLALKAIVHSQAFRVICQLGTQNHHIFSLAF